MENYATLWEAVAGVLPEHRALVRGGVRRPWREFEQRAARLAAALSGLGVAKDAAVALSMFNATEYLESAFATFKLRAVPININYRYVADELEYVLRDADAQVLVYHASLGDLVSSVRARVPSLRAVVQVGDGSDAPLADGALDYEQLIAAHDPAPPIKRSGDDLFILYTGGTTGLPKGVVWRHADLIAGLRDVYALAGAAPPSRPPDVARIATEFNASGRSPVALPTSPLVHGSAFYLAQTTLLLGGTVVLTEGRSFQPHEIWQLVSEEGVTQLGIVGDVFAKPLLQALQEARDRGQPYDLSSLTRIASSGTMWTQPVKRALLDWADVRLVDMLGASEGGPFATAVADREHTPETAQFRLSDRAVVLREDGTEVPHGSGEVGVLALTGPLPREYRNAKEKTAATFRTFRGTRYAVLGDYAVVAADATVRLLGRGSVVINTGGEKVYPEEVEEAVKEHPAVKDCTVVGAPDQRWGELVTAVVSMHDGAQIGQPELRAFLEGRLASYKHPRLVVVVDEVQRSPVGKPSYTWARDVVLQRLGIATSPPA